MPRAPAPPSGPTRSELLFGANHTQSTQNLETASQELSRLHIVTMRQLQRALQNKITQNTRNPMDVWSAFHKLDRRGAQALNLSDLIVAVRGFNLVASDDIVLQLLHALDRDHDGVLSLQEFVAGLKTDSTLSLQQPQYGVSSRRYFKSLKYHHPLHNYTHLSQLHQFQFEEDR